MVELKNIEHLFPLQNYTTFSLLSGIMEPECWTEAIKEKGYNIAGICDKQTLGGVIEFQEGCTKRGVKPVLGSEFLVTETLGKTADKGGNVKGVILLYASNRKGTKNLIRINNFSHKRKGGFHWYPRVSLDFLSSDPTLTEGIICVVPAFEGYGLAPSDLDLSDFKKSLNPADLKLNPDKILKLKDIFKERLFLAINPMKDEMSLKHFNIGRPEKLYCEELKFAHFNNMTMQFPVKKIVTFDSHYINESDHRLYFTISKVKKGSGKASRECKPRDVYKGFIPTREEFSERVEVMTSFDAFDNPPFITVDDVEDCLLNMKELKDMIEEDAHYQLHIPRFPKPTSKDPEGDIIRFVFEGIKANLYPEADISDCKTLDDLEKFRFDDVYPSEHLLKGEDISMLKPLRYYMDQLIHEFKVIKKKDFIDYFWYVRDITNYVDSTGGTRGPARGSGAGALISYLTGITLIDPIRHDLSFERFLNEDRNDLPDIDLDFSKESVLMVREYLKNKYGEEYFARICNYGRLKVVSAIKDIAKGFDYGIKDNNGAVRNYNFTFLNSLTANTFIKATLRGEEELNERIEASEEFAAFVDTHKDWIYGTVLPLLETVTSNGIHASGNLILPEEIDYCLPIIEKSDVGYVSQWCDTDCEKNGFPKFDLLVIDGADIITYMIRLIKARDPNIVVPTIKQIPLDDVPTLKAFQAAKTEGTFQYKTISYKRMLKKFIVDSFNVLVILQAVNRPGPISANVPQYMSDTQHGKRPLTYDHEDLTSILEESYGFMIYQEQMMKIVQVLAGLDGKQADHVRKACGKKKPEDMRKWESIVKSGMAENGYDEEFANDMWTKIVAFSDYSFNKSHAASYALIAYYQMYLKVRFPLEYWSAVMQFASTDSDKDTSIFNVRLAAEAEGIEFIFPTIKYFDDKFYPVKDSSNEIIWPLTAIKGMGPKAVEAICYDMPKKKRKSKKDEIEEEEIDSSEVEEETIKPAINYPKRNSFENMDDMLKKIDLSVVDKGVFHCLIKAGFFYPQFDKPYDALDYYYEYRKDVLKKKGESIPFDMDHTNLFEWELQRNQAFDMIVNSWKSFTEFSEDCLVIPHDKFDGIVSRKFQDNDNFIIGGYVSSISQRRDKRNKHYAIIEIIDYGEKYTIFAWPDYWNQIELDLEDKRPQVGHLIELNVVKRTFNERPQLGISKADNYVKILCKSEEFDEA